MFKTRASTSKILTSRTIIQNGQTSLPCPSHSSFSISHLCLNTSCQSAASFCSECLIDQSCQQHLVKHKEHIIAWPDFITLCKKLSVTGRLGDDPQKDMHSIILQAHVHQQQFKQYMKQQEQQINIDFDALISKFTLHINKIKNDLMQPFKSYLNDLQQFGSALERMVQDQKGEAKDYDNDFDHFLKEVSTIQQQMEMKSLRSSLSVPPVNLRKLMQNIIPLVSRANSQFHKNLSQQKQCDDNQSSVSGLTLFSTFTMADTFILNDTVQDYKALLDNRPCYKNQGLAQQVYNNVAEQIQKIYHQLDENLQNYIVFKAKAANKENVEKYNSPKRAKTMVQVTVNRKTMNDDSREIERVPLRQVNQGLVESEQIVTIDHKKSIATTHKGGINCMVQVDEDIIATGSNDRTVKIWHFPAFLLEKEIAFKSDVSSLATLVRPDGSSMLIVGLYKQICLLNQAFEVVRYFEGSPVLYQGQINALLPLSDGQSVLTCAQSDNKVIQWNVMDLSIGVKKYFEHRDSVTCLSMVNDDKHIASGGKDRNIKIYKLSFYDKDFKGGALEKMQLSLSIQDAHSTEITAICGNGQTGLFSMCSTGELKFWDINDGSLIRSMKNYSGWGYRILYFSDSKTKQHQFHCFQMNQKELGNDSEL